MTFEQALERLKLGRKIKESIGVKSISVCLT